MLAEGDEDFPRLHGFPCAWFDGDSSSIYVTGPEKEVNRGFNLDSLDLFMFSSPDRVEVPDFWGLRVDG
jgi:hypothetical protein